MLLITNKWMKGTLAKFRLGVCGPKKAQAIIYYKRRGKLTCPMCGQACEDGVHFLFQCQAYANLRMKYNIFDSATTEVSMKHVSTLLAS